MILYKYLPPRLLDVLEHQTIRFTQPGDFNDPFEFRPHIQAAASDPEALTFLERNLDRAVEDELAKYGALLQPGMPELLRRMVVANKVGVLDALKRLEPKVLDRLSPSIDALLNEKIGVLCLSEAPDSILMWGHYTDNHQGYLIGFDSTNPFFSKQRTDQDEFGFLRRVDYRPLRPKVVLSDTSSPAWFQTKSDHWAYEREWRMLRVVSEADSRIPAEPFPICLFSFPADAVLQIIIGLRSTPSFVQRIETLTGRFKNATLLRAREDPLAYSLVIEEAGGQLRAGST